MDKPLSSIYQKLPTYCKANSCHNSTNYSWDTYCPYHEKCLSKLREHESSINNIQEIETFET